MSKRSLDESENEHDNAAPVRRVGWKRCRAAFHGGTSCGGRATGPGTGHVGKCFPQWRPVLFGTVAGKMRGASQTRPRGRGVESFGPAGSLRSGFVFGDCFETGRIPRAPMEFGRPRIFAEPKQRFGPVGAGLTQCMALSSSPLTCNPSVRVSHCGDTLILERSMLKNSISRRRGNLGNWVSPPSIVLRWWDFARYLTEFAGRVGTCETGDVTIHSVPCFASCLV